MKQYHRPAREKKCYDCGVTIRRRAALVAGDPNKPLCCRCKKRRGC